jgi:hypothetical protein
MSARTARVGVGGHAPSKDTLLGAKGAYYLTSVPGGILTGTHGLTYTERLAAHSIFAHTNSSITEKGKSHGGRVIETNVSSTRRLRTGIESGPKSPLVVSKGVKDAHV